MNHIRGVRVRTFTKRKRTNPEEVVMGLLKQREERTAVIALRVPSSLKAQFQVLRKRTDDAGFDLSATILEALTKLAKQVRDELDLMRDDEGRIIGRATSSATEKLQ